MTPPHNAKRMTNVILTGTIVMTASLTLILFLHGLWTNDIMKMRIILGFVVLLYLMLAKYFITQKHYGLSGWMLLTLYMVISISTLLTWGLNTPVGILAIGFVVFLSGTMLGTKHIPWVVAIIILMLLAVQYIHVNDHIKPNLSQLSEKSDYFDVLTYTTILSVFALVSWLAGKQTEHSLSRAKAAEEKVRFEKEKLAFRLEEESRRLHEAQLQEMVNLYKFAEIGQSTTATLHELSNLLSVLTLDIDDIGQRYKRSEAITNAKDGINHINHLVVQAKRQLYDNRTVEVFNIFSVMRKTANELMPKFKAKKVKIHLELPKRRIYHIKGDARNFSHVLTILLNNAYDSLLHVDNPKVTLRAHLDGSVFKVDIIDNGSGIPKDKQKTLFYPHKSSKPFGLGIGLYITRNIIENQFRGKIALITSSSGAHFSIELPLSE